MSKLLVFLQFLLIALIAYPSRMPDVDWISGGLFTAGLVIFIAALWTMKRQTFTVMPEPKAGGQLVTSGIYGFVRHPMYLAAILCAIGASAGYGLSWKWMLSSILIAVLYTKLRREEGMLLRQYDGYRAYMQRTKALFPFLF